MKTLLLLLVNTLASVGSLFIPGKKADNTVNFSALPYIIVVMLIVSGSCAAQNSQNFGSCVKDYLSGLKEVFSDKI